MAAARLPAEQRRPRLVADENAVNSVPSADNVDQMVEGWLVAEALERGKRVITTDGAPAWQGCDYGGRLRYLVGYRDGTRETCVKLLKEAIKEL